MGGSVSAGKNNDELIDNLVESGLIKTQMVERVFRAVDRGLFYLPQFKESAYRDLAWREGLLHISAPCIYSRVMEALELKPNQYFLNIGSGTGYFSSMVGLIIGSNGVNHNIELHEELVNYSKSKVSEFIKNSIYFDDFDFCVPKFVQGNVLNLKINEHQILYDRIYVGAGVSNEQEDLIKTLLKVDGILVMPLNDCLIKIKRLNENSWDKTNLMSVSYASLVTDNIDLKTKIELPHLKPYSLQELCRFKIRQYIRDSIESEYNDYYKINRLMSTFNSARRNSSQQNGEQTNYDSDYINESDNDNDDDNDEHDESLSRFERFLRPIARTSTDANQLRLMIYSNLLEPRDGNSFAITLRPRDSVDIENENNLDESLISNENERINEVESDRIDIPTQSQSESNQDNQNFDANKKDSISDSGVSEGSQASSLTNQNSIINCKKSNKTNKQDLGLEEDEDEDESIVSNASKNKDNKTNKKVFMRNENLLRQRILKLPLSTNVKSFLLYNRDI